MIGNSASKSTMTVQRGYSRWRCRLSRFLEGTDAQLQSYPARTAPLSITLEGTLRC